MDEGSGFKSLRAFLAEQAREDRERQQAQVRGGHSVMPGVPNSWSDPTQNVNERVDTLDYRLGGLVKMHQELRKDADRLRDRLYEHEKTVFAKVRNLEDIQDQQQDELSGINGVDGDRIDAMATQLTNVAAAVDDHAAKLATIYGKDLGRITAAEERLDALEGVAAAPESLCKVQYRFGIGAWRDYEPDNAGFLSVGSDGRGLMQIRVVRK